MSNLDHLIKKFGPGSLKPTKEELNLFVKESLTLINEINQYYKKFFEKKVLDDGSTKESILNEVQEKINKICDLYQKYFIDEDDDTWNSIVSDVEDFIQNIKEYHQDLLEWTDSIQSSIKNSYDKIEEFYAYLFSKIALKDDEDYTSDWFISWDIRSEKLKEYISNLKNSYEKIEWTEDKKGYRDAIESFYNYLYNKQNNWISNVEKTKKDIDLIQNFRDNKYDKIISEIEQAKRDVNSLVNAATAGSLVEWYEKSKAEYKLTEWSFERIRFKPNSDWNYIWWQSLLLFLGKITRNFERVFGYFLSQIFNYVLFIGPLVGAVFIFVHPESLTKLGISTSNSSSFHFLNRLIISIPLWWISLFGQRNLAQKKRIAEEYNHKIQVLKMYLNFTTNDSQYLLDKTIKQELQKEVLEVIKRRPGDIYWKDESMFDKLIELIRVWKDTFSSKVP